jgi:16S rRNA (cytidine1402-2'-O)-methyltransferase
VSERGRLLVVGTPIGNLGDLAPRAAEALRSADLIVAEDTRVAARLLAHLGAGVATISFNAHNAERRLPALLARLAAGETLALTTDAGMPGVSDPGAALVAAARVGGAEVQVVPGPSAVTAAMALAGVEATGFVFGGFLPSRPAGERRRALERLLDAARRTELPLVLYESPHRIRALLAVLGELAATARIGVGRELTKRHEEMLVGTPAEVAAALSEERGEFVLVASQLGSVTEIAGGELDVTGLLGAGRRAGLSNRSLSELLRGAGLARREAYRLVEGTVDQER